MSSAAPRTPNLLIFRPVEMRVAVGVDVRVAIATRAGRPAFAAMPSMRSSSPADSTLIALRPSGTAQSSSAAVLPTPVKTMSEGANPALRATSISQIEFASTALPSPPSSRTMPKVEFALSA